MRDFDSAFNESIETFAEGENYKGDWLFATLLLASDETLAFLI